MTSFREHVEGLRSVGELASVTERVHWADTAPAVGAEAARANAPAVVLEDTVGYARLVGGAYGGRDRMAVRAEHAWARLALGLGRQATIPYPDLLRVLGRPDPAGEVDRADLAAREVTGTDIRSLGLPAVGTTDTPAITLGMASVGASGRDGDGDGGGTDGHAADYAWAPVRGSIHGSDRIRAVFPAGAAPEAGGAVSIGLGVPAAALSAAVGGWTGEGRRDDPGRVAAGIDSDLALGAAAGGPLPASTEVVVDCEAVRAGPEPGGVAESWELATDTRSVELRVTAIATRDSPLVPFSPTGAPMADDTLLLGTLEAARLHARLNNYWGVAPVEWVALPAETRLGVCLVASDVLYAGFEWQLANALFAFSPLFDKVVVLEADTPPMDLARAFDDLWVKAHPSHDWEFSEPAAPAAAAPLYRRDGATGSNLYVNAAWDPRWDGEYIAPRVSFASSYPEEVRHPVRERWLDLGFENAEGG